MPSKNTRRSNVANGLARIGDLIPDTLPAELFIDVIRPDDIGYTHPVLVQCFLPVRHNKDNAQWWQTNCGRASIAIQAGRLVDPKKSNTFYSACRSCWPKSANHYGIHQRFIYRERSQIVPLGDSLGQAMERMGVPIGGKVAKRMSFWIERNPKQQTFLQPDMTVSDDYFEAVTQREMTPFYWPALLRLPHSPRAMDIHAFLSYRLHKGLERPVTLTRQLYMPCSARASNLRNSIGRSSRTHC